MRRLSGQFVAAALLLPAGLGSGATSKGAPSAPAGWNIADATFRYTFVAGNPPSLPEAGWVVEVPELGHTMPNSADVLLLDPSGKPVAVERGFRADGMKVVLVAKGLQSGQEYSVYYGGARTRAVPTWTPKPGLFLEIRRMAPGTSMDSPDSLETAWKASTSVDGAGYVSSIALNDNPFGEGSNFLSRYRGWLKPGAMNLPLLVASCDASFLWINKKLEIAAPGLHGPVLTLSKAAKKQIPIPEQGVLVDFLHAKSGAGLASARLGYIRDGNQVGLFEKDQWVTPGTTERVKLEHIQFGVIPLFLVNHRDYIGWDGLWLFDSELKFAPGLPADCGVTWDFTDGGKSDKPVAERVLSGLNPIGAIATLKRGTDSLRMAFRFSMGGRVKEASINNPADLERYLRKLASEDLSKVDTEALKGFFRFAREFGTEQQTGKIAAAWIARNPDPSDPNWIIGLLARLRGTAQADPKAALAELAKIPPPLAKRFLKELALFELETRVILLKDDSAVAFAQQLLPAFVQQPEVVQTIRTRIGDLYRLQGRLKEAEEIYAAVQKTVQDESAGRKFAAQDRANAVTVGNLIDGGYRVEAEARLQLWELVHPMAKLQSDFLLLRAQAHMLFGRWGEALQEVDSFKALNPESPFQIPADFHRARALDGLGRKEEARKIWSAIVTQYPKHPLAESAWRLKNSP
jgi:tetratricopeptide (TPR) repeat protein